MVDHGEGQKIGSLQHTNFLIKNAILSGKLTWLLKMAIDIVYLPIENCDFP
jgi:hypothetical protein